MSKRKLLAALLAGLLATGAQAEFETGNTLLSKLDSTSIVDRMFGTGFVVGVFDVYQHVEICTNNAPVTVGQVTDMARNYLANNPALRHYTAESLIVEAFKQVWPCAQRNNRRNGV